MTDVIAHADRGTQYTSHEYLTFCANNGLRPSVGRTGVCYDNAVAESFWASLKRECLHTKPTFATRAEARRAFMRWVHWYNTGRIHTTLGVSHPSSGNTSTIGHQKPHKPRPPHGEMPSANRREFCRIW